MTEEMNVEYQKARKVADGIIGYLSKEVEGFRLIDLLVKCEKSGIKNYSKILAPSKANFLRADGQTLTKIVQLYDENLVVKNGTVLNLKGSKDENAAKTKNYAEAISKALDKIN